MSDFFLPEALMMNIWLRLPTQSTVRFQCVSKSWRASLSDPQFIYKNLTLFYAENQNENDLLLVLLHGKEHYSVVSHGTTLAATPLQMSPLRAAVEEVLEDVLEEVGGADYIDVLTYCCDDLVCFHEENGGEVIGVWNLTTGERKILPSVTDEWLQCVKVGFGFDEEMKDYKIVHIGYYKAGVEVYVYSLRSGNNCWRKLGQPNVPERSSFANSPSFCSSYRDGMFYWCHSKHQILSFDMSSEVFNTFSIPQLPHTLEFIDRICKLKDGSMLLISCTYCYGKKEYNLWVLLEDGVTRSLIKLSHIDWRCGEEQAFPLGFWRNELVFECPSKGRLLIGDPFSNGEPKDVQIDERIDILDCFVWTKGKNSAPLH